MAFVTILPAAFACPVSLIASVSCPSQSSVRLHAFSASFSVSTMAKKFVCGATPSQSVPDLDELVAKSISDAEQVCEGNETSEECVVAWDEVEEISAARAHKRVAKKQVSDPLEAFCKENPYTDECRVYED